MKLLENRYAGRSEADNVFYRKFILRFNPRIRYGIFLLSREYVSDKYFIRACTSSAYKGVTRLNKENLVPDNASVLSVNSLRAHSSLIAHMYL